MPEVTERPLDDPEVVDALCRGQRASARLPIGDRREVVRRLAARGLTLDELADRLMVTEMTIVRDRAWLRARGALHATPEGD